MGAGPALLISPLLALMRNQIAAAERMGIRAATINSDNVHDWNAVEAKLARGEIDILLISPERLANERFRSQVLANISTQISLLVVDEAHCISDWGHDFRPHYRLLERIVKSLPANLRLLATTATANNRVMEDLVSVLGPGLDVSRGDLNRTSLTSQTIRLPSQAERLAWIAEQLASLDGHGIIYTLTVRDANLVADWLKKRGFNVEAYIGETGDPRSRHWTGRHYLVKSPTICTRCTEQYFSDRQVFANWKARSTSDVSEGLRLRAVAHPSRANPPRQ